jgi:RNA polymerase sigma factor (sigma-70 family)
VRRDPTLLYVQFRTAIYRRCRRLLADAAAAEDATQMVFLRVHEQSIDFPDLPRAAAWLHRTATNHCLNELRSRRRHTAPEARGPGPLPEQWLSDRDLLRRLGQVLPEELTAVARLYHVDGVEQAEIARRIGVSRRTVIARLNRFSRSARAFFEGAAPAR